MKMILLAALCLIPVSFAFAEGEAPKPTEDKTVEPPRITEDANQGLFDRVRSAHARAVQRGVVITAPKS
jgi:hypothetical protein